MPFAQQFARRRQRIQLLHRQRLFGQHHRRFLHVLVCLRKSVTGQRRGQNCNEENSAHQKTLPK
jgi:hypothetical protein